MQATRAQKRAKGTSPSQILIDAARRYRVPVWALVGVKLAETGSDPNAANPFQFEPGTAASAGVRNVNDLSESANAAAKLLASYKRQFGSWNAAFEAYNGGPGAVGGGYAYGESHIKAKLNEFGASELASGSKLASFNLEGLKSLLDKVFGYSLGGIAGGNKAVEGLHEADPGKLAEGLFPAAIPELFSKLLDVKTWLRILEILGGAALLVIGLKVLTGAELPRAGLTVGG